MVLRIGFEPMISALERRVCLTATPTEVILVTRNLMVRHEVSGARFLAPDVGVEPTLAELEAAVLP